MAKVGDASKTDQMVARNRALREGGYYYGWMVGRKLRIYAGTLEDALHNRFDLTTTPTIYMSNHSMWRTDADYTMQVILICDESWDEPKILVWKVEERDSKRFWGAVAHLQRLHGILRMVVSPYVKVRTGSTHKGIDLYAGEKIVMGWDRTNFPTLLVNTVRRIL